MTPACRRGPGALAALIALAATGVLAVVTGAVAPAVAQQGSADWASQTIDLGNSRFAPLDPDVPSEQAWPTQPIPHNAAGVPMTPLCATFVELDDPELASRSSQFYSPYWVSKAVIVPHGGSSFGAPAFSPDTGVV